MAIHSERNKKNKFLRTLRDFITEEYNKDSKQRIDMRLVFKNCRINNQKQLGLDLYQCCATYSIVHVPILNLLQKINSMIL